MNFQLVFLNIVKLFSKGISFLNQFIYSFLDGVVDIFRNFLNIILKNLIGCSTVYLSFSIFFTWNVVSNFSKFEKLICNCLFMLRGFPILTPLSEIVRWFPLLRAAGLLAAGLPTRSFGCLRIPTAKLSGSAVTPRTVTWVSYTIIFCWTYNISKITSLQVGHSTISFGLTNFSRQFWQNVWRHGSCLGWV